MRTFESFVVKNPNHEGSQRVSQRVTKSNKFKRQKKNNKMEKKTDFRPKGIIPAVVTPLTNDG
ncbi:MAG: hypothetical protein WAL29_12340, partial [Bacteroidales bacterium]